MSFKSAGRLRNPHFGDRHACGRRRQVAHYLRRPAPSRVTHFTALRAARRRIDIPALGCGRHEHGSRGRTAWRRGCHAPRIAFELPVACTPSKDWRTAFRWRSMFQPHLLQIHLQPLRRSAWGWRCRCPGPSRRRAWSGRFARRLTQPKRRGAAFTPNAFSRMERRANRLTMP